MDSALGLALRRGSSSSPGLYTQAVAITCTVAYRYLIAFKVSGLEPHLQGNGRRSDCLSDRQQSDRHASAAVQMQAGPQGNHQLRPAPYAPRAAAPP